MLPQLPNSSWCWAACVRAILEFKSKPSYLCEIVSKIHFPEHDKGYCCHYPINNACLKAGGASFLVEVSLQSEGVACETRAFPTAHQLMLEIINNRPIILSFDPIVGNEEGHYVVVSGYEVFSTTIKFLVLDPAYQGIQAMKWLSYNSLTTLCGNFRPGRSIFLL